MAVALLSPSVVSLTCTFGVLLGETYCRRHCEAKPSPCAASVEAISTNKETIIKYLYIYFMSVDNADIPNHSTNKRLEYLL